MQNTTTGYRVSPQQQQLWLFQQNGLPCRTWGAVRIAGTLDAARLRDAVETVVQRHEILRTTFYRPAGMKVPLQVIHDQLPVAWQQREAPGGNTAAFLDALGHEGPSAIDLEHGPMVCADLVWRAPDEHVLVLELPALGADRAGLKNLFREIVRAYGGEPLAGEPLQYADFAEWQAGLAQAGDEDSTAGAAFWQALQLSNRPAVRLPGERKPDADGGAPARAVMRLPLTPELVALVESAAAKAGSPVSVFLLGAWASLLWRLTGQDELIVGYELEGRSQAELIDIPGLMARTLPVVASLEDLSIAELARRLKKAVNEAEQWSAYLPVEEPAAGAVQPGFSFDQSLPALEAGGARFTITRVESDISPHSLKLHCNWEKDGAFEFNYDQRCFSAVEVERFAGYFRRLLDGVLREPATRVGSVDLLDRAERQRLVSDFNQTAAAYPETACVHFLFEEQAARTPDRLALVGDSRRWTYAELNARANQLAHWLRRQGVKPGTLVGLSMERTPDAIVAVLGILKAGGAYVPLHPEQPKNRLTHQIRETQTPVILTQEKVLAQLPPFQGQMLCIDRDAASLDREAVSNPERVNGAEDLVYVIYTSGSTGTPKGVAVRHRNLVNYAWFIRNKLDLENERDGLHFATVSTLSADLGNTAVYPALISGGCLHIIAYETGMDGGALARYQAQHPIDVLKITPSHLKALLSHGDGKGILPRRHLFLGGEAVTWDLVQCVRDLGSCGVINHYGPTETTVGSLTYDVPTGGPAVDSATVPIGRPIGNTQVYLLDSQQQPIPVGVAGELCIGGAGVTAGYLNQPEQTAERFIRDPFSSQADARLYRTGDLARHLPDGNVEFLGRVDFQVKIRGFRVEPAEIESVLCRHSAVRQAVVVTRPDAAGERSLVAYIVPMTVRGLAVDELRGHLLQQLPDYMVPSAFVALDSLPLNANGKVDRRALPDPDDARLASTKTFTAPRNAMEAMLASIWAEVLGVEQVGVEDDFFELGGHSLLATQVVSRARTAFEVELPLRSLFESPTVAGLAAVIQQLRGGADDDLDRMMAELEDLPEEEVQRLLAAEMEGEAT